MQMAPDPLLTLVYSSAATAPFDARGLDALVDVSRRNNSRRGVTGWLLYRRGRFVQVLEGPETAVREQMAVIAADRRHGDVRMLLEETADARRYPDWTMELGPYSETVAAAIPGYDAVFAALEADADAASPLPPRDALREMVRWFRARAAQSW